MLVVSSASVSPSSSMESMSISISMASLMRREMQAALMSSWNNWPSEDWREMSFFLFDR